MDNEEAPPEPDWQPQNVVDNGKPVWWDGHHYRQSVQISPAVWVDAVVD